MRRVITLLVAVLALAPALTQSQNPQTPPADQPAAGQQSNCEPGAWVCRQQERDLDKRRNSLRHAELKSETERLLSLAQELKRDVDQSNEHTLAYGVVRKAEEIEKLAKSVKNKMRGW